MIFKASVLPTVQQDTCKDVDQGVKVQIEQVLGWEERYSLSYPWLTIWTNLLAFSYFK